MSDIAEIEAHRDRAQAAYDKLPLSGPVTSWCVLYGEDLLDSCTKLLAALKQRSELIDATAGHWLEFCRTTSPPIAWEGAIDGAMEAVCKEVERLRARVAELEAEAFALAPDQCHHGYGAENGDHRCKYQDRIAELEAAQEWRPASDEGYKDGKMILAAIQAKEDDGRLIGPLELALLQWIDGELWEGGQYAIDPEDYSLIRWVFAPDPPKVAT